MTILIKTLNDIWIHDWSFRFLFRHLSFNKYLLTASIPRTILIEEITSTYSRKAVTKPWQHCFHWPTAKWEKEKQLKEFIFISIWIKTALYLSSFLVFGAKITFLKKKQRMQWHIVEVCCCFFNVLIWQKSKLVGNSTFLKIIFPQKTQPTPSFWIRNMRWVSLWLPTRQRLEKQPGKTA